MKHITHVTKPVKAQLDIRFGGFNPLIAFLSCLVFGDSFIECFGELKGNENENG